MRNLLRDRLPSSFSGGGCWLANSCWFVSVSDCPLRRLEKASTISGILSSFLVSISSGLESRLTDNRLLDPEWPATLLGFRPLSLALKYVAALKPGWNWKFAIIGKHEPVNLFRSLWIVKDEMDYKEFRIRESRKFILFRPPPESPLHSLNQASITLLCKATS